MSIECILNRRSVRKYTAQEVSENDLRALLKAGMVAPSAMNKKPWEFIVVRDESKKKSIAQICPYWQPAQLAPLLIVVCADLREHDETTEAFYVQDCSCASENILCAAEGLGLGAVWLGAYGVGERVLGLQDVLQIPSEVYPISLLAIGHPENHPAPHDIFDADKVYYEVYGASLQ